MPWAEFNEMLERELQKDEENRFPSWDALRIIYLFLVCVCVSGGGLFPFKVKGKNNKLFN